MTNRHARPMEQRPTACPACGGPPLHPGDCVDHDGYVLPAYQELARTWQDQGRPQMSAAELVDIDALMEDREDDAYGQ